MMRIEISVIMPVYNMVEYVGDAIESILNQTFSKFELIIIDDASTDGTDRVLYSYVDYRIMIERNERNIGNYASRNKGIQKARGKYIAIMDADDIAIPTRLEKQISYLKIHPNVLAIGSDCIYIPINQKKSRAFTYLDIQIALLENNCFVHSSLMIRADILRQLHGYDEYYYYSSDYDLACRLVLLGEVENLSDPLILYRWHASQITTLHGEEQKKYADEITLTNNQDGVAIFLEKLI